MITTCAQFCMLSYTWEVSQRRHSEESGNKYSRPGERHNFYQKNDYEINDIHAKSNT